jgi:membrane protease YdiL (CAAX protease family)
MTALASAPSRLRLWTEFLLLFVGIPILMAVFFELLQRQRLLFSIIWLLAGVSAILLWRTPGWEFSKLWRGPVLSKWRLILVYWLVTAATCLVFVFTLVPENFLALPKWRPELWMLIMIAYPVASAWPQEVIFRSLFFERYGSLFPGKWTLIAANGAAFGFGHLFYDSWVTIGMTAIGGAIMGWAYLTQGRSMLLAWVLHALAGQLIFTSGLGVFFYSGAVN